MAQQVDRAALAPDALPSDRAPEDLAIFSGPGVDVVMHWWAESNRRWTERDRLKTLEMVSKPTPRPPESVVETF
jgi:hypothetical protein